MVPAPTDGRWLTLPLALLLVLQNAGGEGGDRRAEERNEHPRPPRVSRSVPQHQAERHPCRRRGALSSHGTAYHMRVGAKW